MSTSYLATLLDVDRVLHAYPEGQNEDQPYASASLHQWPIKVHRPVLLADGCWRHLDLGPFHNKIGQCLGLDGRPRGIRNGLTHQLECPLGDSPYGILVLDDLAEREEHHDHHRV